jgi:hypothetical protein
VQLARLASQPAVLFRPAHRILINFAAQKVATGKGLTLWRVDGESEVFLDDKMIHGRPGDMHEIKLKWHGFIEIDENRMTRLVMSANGSEKLKFARLFDMACQVRFGIIGEPVTSAEKK